MKKRLMTLLLAIVCAIAIVPPAWGTTDVVASGDCGKIPGTVQYIVFEDGTLRITGKGEMKDYSVISSLDAFNASFSDAKKPWQDYEITSIFIDEGVTSVGGGAFNGLNGIVTELSLPHTMKSVGDRAFSTLKLKVLEIPDGVERIGKRAFSGSRFEEIKIPATVSDIGDQAFVLSAGVGPTVVEQVVTVDEHNPVFASYNGALYSKDYKTLIYYPNSEEYCIVASGVKVIAKYCFMKNNIVRSIVLPAGLIAIEEGAFVNCPRLHELYIPSSVRLLADSKSVSTDPFLMTSFWDGIDYGGSVDEWKQIYSGSESNVRYNVPAPQPTIFIPREKPSTWATAEILAAIELGLIPEELQNGYRSPMARQDMARMIISLQEMLSGETIDVLIGNIGVSIDVSTFVDTADQYVLAASALGILNGTGGGRFSPDGILQREQLAVVSDRMARLNGISTDGYGHHFVDVVGRWSEKEFGWCTYVGVLKGVGDNLFDPTGTMTREQAFVVFYRLYCALR